MKKVILNILFTLSLLLFFTQCNSKDDTVEPSNSIDDTLEPIDTTPTTSKGVFLDSPVQGLSYASSSVSGITDSEGTFEYENNETISFSIGGILIGETVAKEVVTPLDLVVANINNQEVRNIASFLQSLDNDNDPSNGIVIAEDAVIALSSETLDFSSNNFFVELTELINSVNTTNSSSLTVVNSNDAALHLANSLNLENEFEFLPRVIQGREWEEGEYYPYTTIDNGGYILKIGSDLNGVRYSFGDGVGFYMNMTYEQNKLSGFGNLYSDLDATPPVNPNSAYDYRNRITSPGFVFDYQNNTYIGYINFFKKEGELGKLQGTYEYFFYYDQKRVNEEPEIGFFQRQETIIGDSNEDGKFPVQQITYDINDTITNDISFLVDKEAINNENIVLVRFQETDHIFVNTDFYETGDYFYAGIFAIKK